MRRRGPSTRRFSISHPTRVGKHHGARRTTSGGHLVTSGSYVRTVMTILHTASRQTVGLAARVLSISMLCLLGGAAQSQSTVACQRAGAWVDPSDGKQLAHTDVIAKAATKSVVLLGETHDDIEHHRWQLSTLAGFRAHRPDVVVGFEAFPRRLQPVLDRWTRGELQTTEFLHAAEWRRWGYDSAWPAAVQFCAHTWLTDVRAQRRRSLVSGRAERLEGRCAYAKRGRERPRTGISGLPSSSCRGIPPTPGWAPRTRRAGNART